MKTVAFLQNQWFKDPERVKRMIARSADPKRFRRLLIARALFAGCRTGMLLRRFFEDDCDTIVWEEASTQIGGNSRALFPADLAHIAEVITEEKPNIVLAFGSIASTAVKEIRLYHAVDFFFMQGPHPARRDAYTQDNLREMATAYRATKREFQQFKERRNQIENHDTYLSRPHAEPR